MGHNHGPAGELAPVGSGDRPPIGTDSRADDGRTKGLALAALGVVFGDIGTSPL